jgi:tetratricopeptide (TPR) repeat protein
VWDAATGKPVTQPLKHNGIVRHIEFSPDGRRVATASEDGTAQVWDARTGSKVASPLKHKDSVWHVTFSPDGRTVATASSDTTAGIWDVETGQLVIPSLQHPSVVDSVRFSPDGHRVVTACSDTSLSARDAQVWDVATGRPLGPPLRHGDGVECAAFSADGKRLVTASEDQTARVWDAVTGQPITPPIVHGHTVAQAWFSKDGRRIVTGCWGDGSARVWDAVTGEPLTPPLRQGGKLRVVTFSPDDRRLLTAGDNGSAHIWELPQDDRPAADLVLRARLLGSHFIDSTGGMVALDPAYVRTGWQRMRQRYPDDMVPPPFSAITTWHRREAERAERKSNWFAAAWNLERLVKLDPQDASAHTRLGQARAEMHDWKAVVTAFTQAIDKGAAEPDIALWRGWAYTHLNQTDQAMVDFGKALDHSPQDATIWLALYFVHCERSEWAQADADWTKAVRSRTSPSPSQWRLLVAHLSAAIEEGHDGWWAWRTRGYAREPLDQWQDAAADYLEATQRKPDDWRNWSSRAWALRKLERWEECIASYSRSIELQPRATHTWGMRGDTYAITGQWEKAAADFAKWAELGGEGDVIPWHHHACLRLYVDDIDGYRHICKRILDRYGASNEVAILALAVRTCVLHADAVDDPEQLVRLAETVVAANRKKGSSLFLLGAASYRAGQFEQAVQRLEESVEADPGWRATRLSAPLLALAHQRLGHTAEAEKWLEETEHWFNEVSKKISHSDPAIPPSPWYEWLEFQLFRNEVDGLRGKANAVPP